MRIEYAFDVHGQAPRPWRYFLRVTSAPLPLFKSFAPFPRPLLFNPFTGCSIIERKRSVSGQPLSKINGRFRTNHAPAPPTADKELFMLQDMRSVFEEALRAFPVARWLP